jgi:hypothetical protein
MALSVVVLDVGESPVGTVTIGSLSELPEALDRV